MCVRERVCVSVCVCVILYLKIGVSGQYYTRSHARDIATNENSGEDLEWTRGRDRKSEKKQGEKNIWRDT